MASRSPSPERATKADEEADTTAASSVVGVAVLASAKDDEGTEDEAQDKKKKKKKKKEEEEEEEEEETKPEPPVKKARTKGKDVGKTKKKEEGDEEKKKKTEQDPPEEKAAPQKKKAAARRKSSRGEAASLEITNKGSGGIPVVKFPDTNSSSALVAALRPTVEAVVSRPITSKEWVRADNLPTGVGLALAAAASEISTELRELRKIFKQMLDVKQQQHKRKRDD
jgi:hypothetical protein